MNRTLHVTWALLVYGTAALPGNAQDSAPARKYALGAGVNGYEHGKSRNLEFAENDARAMAEVLQKNGYEVSLLVNEGAPLATPGARLKEVTAKRNRREIVLVAL